MNNEDRVTLRIECDLSRVVDARGRNHSANAIRSAWTQIRMGCAPATLVAN